MIGVDENDNKTEPKDSTKANKPESEDATHDTV